MALVPNVGDVIVLVTPDETQTPWQREAPARTAVRRFLILICGWHRWDRADRKAEALVRMARAELKIGTPRGWDNIYDPHTWVVIGCCPICDRPFPQHRTRGIYCSRQCCVRAEYIRNFHQLGPLRLRCGRCDELMVDPRPDQFFCSARCRDRARSARASAAGEFIGQVNQARARRKAERLAREIEQPRMCIAPGCDRPVPPGAHLNRRFCCHECKRQVDNLNLNRTARRAERRANGHAHAEDVREVDSETGGLSTARPSPDLGYQKR